MLIAMLLIYIKHLIEEPQPPSNPEASITSPGIKSVMSSKIIKKVGFSALLKLHTLIPADILSVIPPHLEIHKNGNPVYAGIRLRLAEWDLDDKTGCIWAYMKWMGPDVRAIMHLFAELTAPGSSKIHIYRVRSDKYGGNDFHIAFSSLLPVLAAKDIKEVYAFVAYAFLVAAHSSHHGFTDHIVQIDEGFVSCFARLCQRPEFRAAMENGKSESTTGSDSKEAAQASQIELTPSEIADSMANMPGPTNPDDTYEDNLDDRDAALFAAPSGPRKRNVPMNQPKDESRRVRAKLEVVQGSGDPETDRQASSHVPVQSNSATIWSHSKQEELANALKKMDTIDEQIAVKDEELSALREKKEQLMGTITRLQNLNGHGSEDATGE